MVLEALAQGCAKNGAIQVLITEVTHMKKGGLVCVAGINLATGQMVRPVQGDGSNWGAAKWVSTSYFEVGRIVGLDPAAAGQPGFPHATEDLRIATVHQADTVSAANLYAACVETAHADLDAMFDSCLIDDKYVVEGSKCRSLGCLIVDPADLHAENSYGVKLVYDDADNKRHYIKVTELETIAGGDEAAGAAALQERLDGAAGPVALRLGLARAWAGPADQHYDPRRCYMQLNGVILPA